MWTAKVMVMQWKEDKGIDVIEIDDSEEDELGGDKQKKAEVVERRKKLKKERDWNPSILESCL